MKSINTILRVKQMEIDALKRQQGMLENQRDILVTTAQLLSNSLVEELKAAEKVPDMAQFFGNFSAGIKNRQEIVAGHTRKVEAELDKLSNQIRDCFSDMKKFEIALAAHQKRVAAGIKHREQQEMDEIAIRGYTRDHVNGTH
jgi:flagellar biosynthesis chaperone FliJ